MVACQLTDFNTLTWSAASNPSISRFYPGLSAGLDQATWTARVDGEGRVGYTAPVLRMKMVPLVLALNPSIDTEWRVDKVRSQEKNEVTAERRWPGGKGVNVARWLKHLGAPARLLLPLGGPTGRELAGQLRTEGLPARVVRVSQTTRVNVIVTPASGPQFRFNPVWQRISSTDWANVLSAIRGALANASCVVLSGSLPGGAPSDAYARILRLAARAGVRCILDCDGPALAAAVGAKPFLVKPNEHELARWFGAESPSDADVWRAAGAMAAVTRGWVLVSRAERGALLVHEQNQTAFECVAPKVRVRNTVGAGDALLAAVVERILAGAAPDEWLRWGVACGSAAAACIGGALPKTVASLGRKVVVRARIPLV